LTEAQNEIAELRDLNAALGEKCNKQGEAYSSHDAKLRSFDKECVKLKEGIGKLDQSQTECSKEMARDRKQKEK
jgi:hypothetical protein